MWWLLLVIGLTGFGCQPSARTPPEGATAPASPHALSAPLAATSPSKPLAVKPARDSTPDPAHPRLDAVPTAGSAPLVVRFRVSGLPQASALRWAFGDGVIEEHMSGEVAHTYERAGEYQAIVTAIASGQQAMAWVRVSEAPLDVDLEAVPDLGRAPLQVRFQVVLSDPDAPLRSIQWDFGDGHSAEGRAVTHVFTEPGSFLVTARLERESGSVIVRDVYVQVDPSAPPDSMDNADSEGEL